MRVLRLLLVLSMVLWGCEGTTDGLSDAVTWDRNSVMVNGSRVFIFSGEFHYQRMPVPEMWLWIQHNQVGHILPFHPEYPSNLTLISIYLFWSYHSPSKGVYDFETTGKNVQRLFDYAKEAGLWVIARAGPYFNGETNAGGLALWGSDGSMGKLRTSDEAYHQSWIPWVEKIGKIIADNEVSKGGTVILNQVENELQETTHSANNTLVIYMKQLKKAFRDAGITVPLTHNEKGMRSMSWSTDYQDVGGSVNMYGLDSYPGGLKCDSINSGFNLVRTYHQWFSNYSYTQPNHFPEFEAGYFTPWGGSFYDDCASELDPAFADVYYKNNIAQRTTILSLYMAWGGTNWGHSAAPVVYSSYDYSAPLRETRQIRDKLSQTKLIALFTRASKDLLTTDMIGNGTGYAVSDPTIFTWHLRNPTTLTSFYTLQQNKSSSRTSITFSATLETSLGNITVPNINLNGRQSKILVTDYKFGTHTLLYCSADILTYGVFGDVDVLVLYLEEGQVGEFGIKTDGEEGEEMSEMSIEGDAVVESVTTYTQTTGQTVLQSDNLLIYLLEKKTAWRFWAPPTTTNPNVQPNEQIFVLGPYLVRSASITDNTVYISGDNDISTTIEIYTGTPITTISWNGILLPATTTPYGSVTAPIPGAEERTISLPALEDWMAANSLPEKENDYDDSLWTICNKTTTLSPIAPLTLPVLFSSDYGFYVGAKIYRGYFDGDEYAAVNITASGGLAFGWSAWLNGVLIGGDTGNVDLPTTTVVLSLPKASLKGSDNLVTVVVDYHGHDQTSTAKGVENPRGILGAFLIPSNTTNSTTPYTKPEAGVETSTTTGFKLWKIQGNAGGSSNLDPTRGPMNEGGLLYERLGWALPSFPSSSTPQFSPSPPLTGLNTSGITFYTTTFTLALDSDLDVPLGIALTSPQGTVARVQLWVNGYQYGKYVPHIGPQSVFPVPPGVVNNNGVNTLGVSIWAMNDEGARLEGVELVSYGVYQTGFGFAGDWGYLQAGWEVGREGYA
ncbi:hypothetical protein HYALB_00004714 [Hymenoscyphus albidus]|uniref:beta-galactosidase n=1 Tax=Hymenoscyphus albidus TaxID=595503 RepID=A0A9N9M0G6_9HELO|nr:hypothetical protein HYALB_00004714 [Hymenoscyphus albidus]